MTFTSADIDTLPRAAHHPARSARQLRFGRHTSAGSICLGITDPSAWGDLNTDGTVDARDAERLFAAWGTSHREADVNEDGWVDAADAEVMFAQWNGGQVVRWQPYPSRQVWRWGPARAGLGRN